MNKRDTLNLGALVCLIAATYCIYYLLLHDNVLPFSIAVVSAKISHWVRHWHVLVVGLMPIYVALMIFGTGLIGIYLGSALQRWITRFLHQPHK